MTDRRKALDALFDGCDCTTSGAGVMYQGNAAEAWQQAPFAERDALLRCLESGRTHASKAAAAMLIQIDHTLSEDKGEPEA